MNSLNTRRLATAAGGLVTLAALLAGAGCAKPQAAGGPGDSSSTPATNATTTTSAAVSPDSSVAKYGVRLDVLEGDSKLRTTDGHLYDLGPGRVTSIARVPLGWVYV